MDCIEEHRLQNQKTDEPNASTMKEDSQTVLGPSSTVRTFVLCNQYIKLIFWIQWIFTRCLTFRQYAILGYARTVDPYKRSCEDNYVGSVRNSLVRELGTRVFFGAWSFVTRGDITCRASTEENKSVCIEKNEGKKTSITRIIKKLRFLYTV